MNIATAAETKLQEAIEINPLFARHDLMIEMARLEMEIETARGDAPEQEAEQSTFPLEQRLAAVADVLARIAG